MENPLCRHFELLEARDTMLTAENAHRQLYRTIDEIFALKTKLSRRLQRKGVYRPADQEDIFQELMVLLLSRGTLPIHADHLNRVLADLRAKWFRKNSKRTKELPSERLDELEFQGSPEIDDSNDAYQVLSRVPPADQSLLRMAYLDSLPRSEIAHRLGVSRTTIANRLRQIKRALNRRRSA